MNERVNSTLLQTLQALDTAGDADIAFLFASTTNLYIEGIRRLHARVMLRSSDIVTIFAFITAIIEAKVVEDYAHTGRSRELTDVEKEALLGAIESETGRRV